MLTVSNIVWKCLAAILTSLCVVGFLASAQQQSHLEALRVAVESRPVIDESLSLSIGQLNHTGVDIKEWQARAIVDIEQGGKVQEAIQAIVDQAIYQQRILMVLWVATVVANFLALFMYWRKR